MKIGAGAVVTNDGDGLFGLSATRSHNAPDAVPFRQRDDAAARPDRLSAQSRRRAKPTAPGFAPFQREDAEIGVTYEPGVATFRKTRGALATEYEIFVPPDFPGDMRLLTISNQGDEDAAPARDPFFDMALDEGPNESAGNLIGSETVDGVLLFENPHNDFQRGVAFATTSLSESEDGNHPRAVLRRRRAATSPPRHGRDRRSRRSAARRRTPGRRFRRGHRTFPWREYDALPSLSARRRQTGRARRRGRTQRRLCGAAACRDTLALAQSSFGQSRSRPTAPTSIVSSTHGCLIKSTPRVCSAGSAPTSAAAPTAIAINCRMCCRSS